MEFQEKSYKQCQLENIPYIRVLAKGKVFSSLNFDYDSMTPKNDMTLAIRKFWYLSLENTFRDYYTQDILRQEEFRAVMGTTMSVKCRNKFIPEFIEQYITVTELFKKQYMELSDSLQTIYNIPFKFKKMELIPKSTLRNLRDHNEYIRWMIKEQVSKIDKDIDINAESAGVGEDVR